MKRSWKSVFDEEHLGRRIEMTTMDTVIKIHNVVLADH